MAALSFKQSRQSTSQRYEPLKEHKDDGEEELNSVDLARPTITESWTVSHDKLQDQLELARRRILRLRIVAWIEGVLVVALFFGLVVMQTPGQPPLGVDPSGFVPSEIGQPARWTKYDDESDPHTFKMDVLDSMVNIREAARKFKLMHNSSNVRINGKYTTYMDFDNTRQPLPPYVTRMGSELYSIRAFHQMHCIGILLEDVGYRVHNHTSKWDHGHVIHCLNTLRSAVTCLADATPISYLHGLGVGHTTDGQQAWCRDFYALREWAHHPDRRIRWLNVAAEDETDRFQELVGWRGI